MAVETLLHRYVRELLSEKEIRSQKNKRTLYHAGQRPAAPKPKTRWFQRGQENEGWARHWLDSPVKSGVFLTPNPVDIAQFHGVSGNVYAYKVPEWVIEKSGGIHRYDKGSEILIPEDVWEEAGNEIEFLGKSMSQQELWDRIDRSLHMSRGRQGNPQKPGWISTEEWQQDRAADAAGNHLIGLRNTKHLEQAVKMMTPAERAEALEAFEQVPTTPGQGPRPDWARAPVDDWDRPRAEKDLEIIATLKKYLNESVVRSYVKTLITEQNVRASGMCFPFAYQKAEEWFEAHFTKGVPGRAPKKHPDLNNKDKFKVVHGTVTDKWKSPPKPIVHGWVEMGDLVFDAQTSATKPNGIEKEAYYDMYRPEVYKEFTAEEAVINCAMMGGEGPWDDDLYSMMQDRDAWMKA